MTISLKTSLISFSANNMQDLARLLIYLTRQRKARDSKQEIYCKYKEIEPLTAGFGIGMSSICNNAGNSCIIRLFSPRPFELPIPFMENYAIMA
jgi:hypothetical protein